MGKARRHELRLVRQDRMPIKNGPKSVFETFDIEYELEATVGKHFLPMAAEAAGKKHKVAPSANVLADFPFLVEYEIEVWRADGQWFQPELTSTSTAGWRV